MMKIFAVLISLLIAVNALSDQEEWISFKNKYGKNYKSLREDSFRFKIFQQNLRKIESHNAKYERGDETYYIGITQHTDFTAEEFHKKFSMPVYKPKGAVARFSGKSVANPAPSVDWREKGAVLPVLNQGTCGSCWAFSTVGSLEGQNAIKYNKKIQLSPQELVDCTVPYGPHGCRGGWMYDAYRYVKEKGISALKDYKYDGNDEKCRNDTTPRVDLKVTGFTLVEEEEEYLRQAVETIGPISTTLYYGWFLESYKGGIYQEKECPTNIPSHAVLAVGYGTENGTDYWIMKNSFGPEYGEKGYFRIIRNAGNMCGLCSHAMYPNVA